MAKSKSKSRTRSKSKKGRKSSGGGACLNYGGHYAPARRRRDYAITAAVLAAAAVAIGTWWWWSASSKQEFLALAAAGQDALSKVKTEFSRGGGHFGSGQTGNYDSRFPTSGVHHPVPTEPGFYDVPQPASQLVHAIEHGHIAIYYDRPGAEALETLANWTELYDGHWDGVVATPMPGLGKKVVLTAWTKRLSLGRFEAAAAAAFIDEYRGRGPENRVR